MCQDSADVHRGPALSTRRKPSQPRARHAGPSLPIQCRAFSRAIGEPPVWKWPPRGECRGSPDLPSTCSAPRDDTARAGCGIRAKSNFLPMTQVALIDRVQSARLRHSHPLPEVGQPWRGRSHGRPRLRRPDGSAGVAGTLRRVRFWLKNIFWNMVCS